MEKRKLGNTGTQVSVVGVGAMSFCDFYGKTDTEKSHAVLATALDLGIDHIDTSNVYGGGISEERIGSFLKEQGAGRHELFKIATKAAIGKDAEGRRVNDNSAAHLESELDKSLQRLGVEQVELFYVHRRDPRHEIEDVTETLANIVKKGKARQVGFSEIAPSSLERAASKHPIAAVQSEYSLATRAPELGLVQRCAEVGATLVAFSPVGRSMLTDAPPSAEKIATIPFLKDNPRFQGANLGFNLKRIDAFRRLAADMGVAAATLAVAWVLHQGDHIITIPGTRSVEHLKELAKGAEMKLSASDMEAIERTLPAGWAHGDRYSENKWVGPERYC